MARLSLVALLALLGSPVLAQADFKRGDYNGDGQVNFGDILIGQISPPPPVCEGAGDADGNGVFVFLSDQLYLTNWLTSGGPPPPTPGPYICGPGNGAECISYDSCDVVTCVAEFGITGSSGTLPHSATFTALEFPGATYVWNFGDGTSMTTNVPTVDHEYLDGGYFDVSLEITYSSCQSNLTRTQAVTVLPTDPGFSRGHVIGGTTIGLADVLTLLNYLFLSGATPTCLSAADANDDGSVALNDALVLLNYLFNNGVPPEPPFATCGIDPTPDTLVCTTQCP